MVENLEFDNFISSILKKEILHKFSYFRTLQKKKNGMIKRKNRILQEKARTMFYENKLASPNCIERN